MNRTEAEQAESLGMGDGWIFMRHPDLEDSYTKVTVDAFEEAWADQGWVKVNDLLDENGRPLSESEELPPVEITPEEEAQLLREQERFTGRGEVAEDGDGNKVVETVSKGGAVPTAASGSKQDVPEKEE